MTRQPRTGKAAATPPADRPRTAPGRAILSRMPDEEARRLIAASDRQALTPHTVIDADLMRTAAEISRSLGFVQP